MKWPLSITLVRHGESQYNELRRKKEKDERYQLFKKAFNRDPESSECRELAKEIKKKFALKMSDDKTPLSDAGHKQARKTGSKIFGIVHAVPDVIIVSPYQRTRETFDDMASAAGSVIRVENRIYDGRIREQEHGLSLLYSDWRMFEVFHPEQHALRNLLGPYWYQFPQGESISQVQDRIRLFTNKIIREYAGKHIMLVTHHLTILSIRANFENLSPEEFIRLNEEEKPRNCGVTIYRGNPDRGTDGKLELVWYNRCLWDEE